MSGTDAVIFFGVAGGVSLMVTLVAIRAAIALFGRILHD